MDKVHIFKDLKGEYRWHRKSENGQVVSTSGEGYVSYSTCVQAATAYNDDATLVDDTDH